MRDHTDDLAIEPSPSLRLLRGSRAPDDRCPDSVGIADAGARTTTLDVVGVDLPRLIGAANWLATEAGAPCKGFVRHTGPVPRNGRTTRPLAFNW
ncbi:hypothetical protein HUO13_16045 [Saccharopolyspora erythraea]|uniref:hypothetical protein n=1 Tax=Saccharopolyspora erythraea TaxID=1836 RepID=UPI001BAD35F6|nr:hypothetical protein [Saccharopolyspora erythraea]QUH02105.1 hypothetical protein HUO13_16045 [Saccharopolyspora erythraea]